MFQILMIILGFGLGLPLCWFGAWLPGLTFLFVGIGFCINAVHEIYNVKDSE